MTCRRCGGRMVTKVGRSTPMLICSDCGLPVDQRETAVEKRKRLLGAITLVGMAALGGSVLLLASMNEMRTAGRIDGADLREDTSREEGGEGEQALPEPSGLVDLLAPTPKQAGRLPGAKAGQGKSVSVSAKPGAVEAQEIKEQ